MSKRLTITLLSLAVGAHFAPAQADDNRMGETPKGLSSLIGKQANETELKQLGYDWVRGSDDGSGRHALWYNEKNRQCVRVRVDNNHYQSITATDPRQCTDPQAYRIGETPQGLSSLIGTQADETDLKRLGYNWVEGSDKGPGRHGLWYNAANKQCVKVRIENNHYQSITATEPAECTRPQASNNVGETPQGLASLVGTKADETDLKRLGYNWVEGSDKGPGRHALWYNAKNQQCVRVRVEGDRYQSITEANPNECKKL